LLVDNGRRLELSAALYQLTTGFQAPDDRIERGRVDIKLFGGLGDGHPGAQPDE